MGAAAVVSAVLVSGVAVRVARDDGAFGCAYQDRGRTTTWRLSAEEPATVRVCQGEGVQLSTRESGELHDVDVTGNAGLAPGTQNGFRGYVFTVTAPGAASVTARTASGAVRGSLRATC